MVGAVGVGNWMGGLARVGVGLKGWKLWAGLQDPSNLATCAICETIRHKQPSPAFPAFPCVPYIPPP